MLKDVSFGQFYPAESFAHRLDPRLKILFLIAFITATFLAKNFYGLVLCAAVLVLAVLFSGIPVGKVVRSVKGVLFLVIFTALLNVFFYQGATVYWSWWILRITKEGLLFSAFLALRLALLVMCSSLLIRRQGYCLYRLRLYEQS